MYCMFVYGEISDYYQFIKSQFSFGTSDESIFFRDTFNINGSEVINNFQTLLATCYIRDLCYYSYFYRVQKVNVFNLLMM